MMAVRERGCRGGFAYVDVALVMVMVVVPHKHFAGGQTIVIVESVERGRRSCGPAVHFGSYCVSGTSATGFHRIPTGLAQGCRQMVMRVLDAS